MSVPYTHDDLGEADYEGGQGDPGQPDRYINDQQAHGQFYGLSDAPTTPTPYPG